MQHKNQKGFIPMMIMLLLVVALVIYLAYHHVATR